MQRLLLIMLLASVLDAMSFAHMPFADLPGIGNFKAVSAEAPAEAGQGQAEVSFSVSGKKLIAPVIMLSAGPTPGIAVLIWTTSDAALAGTYYVERQTVPSTVWDTLAQLPYTASLKYSDTISFPNCASSDFVYRIRFVDDLTGVPTFSNTSNTLTLRDQTNPATVHNLFVNNSSAGPVLFWEQVSGDEIAYYKIERFNGFSWDSISAVPADSNRFVDLSVTNACSKINKYVITSTDMCGNRSATNYSQFVQTLNLNVPQIDPCERVAKLSWNSFTAMPGGLAGYSVYRAIDNGVPSFVTSITDTLQATYAYNDNFPFQNGHFYSYYIQANSKSGANTSSSCIKGSAFAGTGAPDSVYIKQVSVEDDRDVSISFHHSPPNTVKKIVLERAALGATVFSAIDSVAAANGFLPSDYILIDTTANVHGLSYSYRIIAVDSCGTIKIYSNVANSILLLCSASQTQNLLSWNSYSGWMQGVEGYKVYHTQDGLPIGGELIGSLLPATLSFAELLTDIDPAKKICYFITAAENPGNPYMTNAISLSNTCCIIKDPVLFMPDAFRPGGKNSRFRPKPQPLFVDPQSFKMTILSRWGLQIFETTDMANGWDGLVKGQYAPSGLYAYILNYKSLTGKDYTKRGTVMLVR